MANKFTLLTRFFTLCIALFMAAIPTLQASAAMTKCRTDPIFRLSNGDVVTVVLDVNTDEANIQKISYILHVPAGVTVNSVEFTPGIVGNKETYLVFQDNPSGFYTSESFLIAKAKDPVAVTANMDVNSIYFQSATGYDKQNLIITLETDTISPSDSGPVSFSMGSVTDDGKILANDSTTIIVTTLTE